MLIGDVARQAGLSARMLRHYDRIGLLSPSGRTTAGYREYTDADLTRLLHVEALRSLGLGLAEVSAALADATFDPRAMIARVVVETRARIARDEELATRLDAVAASEPDSWDDVLRTVGLLRGIDAPTPSERQRVALAADDGRDVGLLVDAMLREPNTDAAGALQWAIARHGDASVPALAAALSDPDVLRRRRALDGLEKIGTPHARDAVAAASGSDDPRIRSRAVLARAARGDDVTAELVGLVAEGVDDIAAVDALNGRDAAGALAAALATADAASRRRLVAAVAVVPGDEARRMLEELAHDADRGTAVMARAMVEARPA